MSDAAFVRRSCLSPGCPNEVEPGELDCETHRAASLNYERVAQIVTEAFNRYHRGEHSDPVFIEHDIADGISLERRRGCEARSSPMRDAATSTGPITSTERGNT